MKKKATVSLLIVLNLFVICLIVVADRSRTVYPAYISYHPTVLEVEKNEHAEDQLLETETIIVGELEIFPINLNTATKEELMLLPRIGDVISDRIIAYRADIGNFTDINQLKDVKGIGDKTFLQLESLITVN